MKILITGGAGYIGTTLTPLLLERGYEVTVLDSLMFGGVPIIPFFRYKNFNFIKGDIRDKQLMENAVKDKDIIIHLAAIVGFPACRENPALAESVNVDGTRILSELVSPDQFVLFGSTGSNYGALVDEVCTEETPLNPLSIYGKTKTAAEKILTDSANCTAYRFATAFGSSPRLRLDLLINEFTYQAVRQKYLVVYESNFMRTFIDVHDIARSFLFAIDHYFQMKGQVYNVGGNNMNFSKKEICEIISKHTGAYIHYADIGEDADKRNYVVSYDKIKNLGYETSISIEEGVKSLVRVMDTVKIINFHINSPL
jgi:nucleoside-diphosphate-sugar epimerase